MLGDGSPASLVAAAAMALLRDGAAGVEELLTVADASVMPSIVSAPTHATVVMIGERAADFLLQEDR